MHCRDVMITYFVILTASIISSDLTIYMTKPGIERVQTLADISRSALCCHTNETHAPIANPPNSAQLEGIPTIPPTYIWIRAVAWECGERHTYRRPWRICISPRLRLTWNAINRRLLQRMWYLTVWIWIFLHIIKLNWNQFLLVVKATALKQQISKFYLQIVSTDASHYVSQWLLIVNKSLIFAVLEW